MRFIEIEHFQRFDDEMVFYAAISDLPENIREAAKRMDGTEYDPDGFGICVWYDNAAKRLCVSRDQDPITGESGNLYYVDKDGNYRWFEADVTEDLTNLIYAECGKIMAGEKGEKPLTKDELAYWLSVTENSRFQWTEDEIFRLNGRGSFYYTGGENGIYMKIGKDGLLEGGDYEGAVPHIGEAMFKPAVKRQCADYSEAFTAAMEAGGKKFLMDMLTPSAPAIPQQTEKTLDERMAAEESASYQPTPKPVLTARIINLSKNLIKKNDFNTTLCSFPGSAEYIIGKLAEIGVDGKRHADCIVVGDESPVAGLASRIPGHADLGEINYLAALVSEMPEDRRGLFGALMLADHYCDNVRHMIQAAKNIDAFDVQPTFSLEEYAELLAMSGIDMTSDAFERLEREAGTDPVTEEFVGYVRQLMKYFDALSYARDLVKEEKGVFVENYGYVTPTDRFDENMSFDVPPEYRVKYPSYEPAREERPSALGRLAAAKDTVSKAGAEKPPDEKARGKSPGAEL